MSAESTEPEAKAEAGLKAVQKAFDGFLNGKKQPVCPHCGRCPVCGKRDEPYSDPWPPWPSTYPYYPPYYSPYITWTTDSDSTSTPIPSGDDFYFCCH